MWQEKLQDTAASHPWLQQLLRHHGCERTGYEGNRRKKDLG